MRVLILGGTGAMGAHLCRLVAAQGAEVSVTTRQNIHNKPGIKYLIGNAKNDDFLKNVLNEHWDCIVDFMAYSTPSFHKRLPLLLANTYQYIFLSSARVYADSETPLSERSPRLLDICEDSEYLNTDEYALAKARQENLLTDSGYSNWTIIRPYITYAEERLQLGVLEKEAWLFRALNERTIVFSSDIAERTTTMTHGVDVAAAIASLIGNKKTFGESFHITSDHSRTWKELFAIYENTLSKHCNTKPKIQYVDLETFIRTHGAKYQIIYDRLYNRVFDNSKIASILSTDSFVTPEIGLDESLRSFLKNSNFLTLDSRSEALRDQITGEFTNLKHFKGSRERMRYLVNRLIKKI